MRVLIADDNKENCYLLEHLLTANGYDVVCVANGVEALAELARDQYGLVISDVLMPEMDGFRLCREVKGDERFTHIPFVFYTATYTDESDRAFALSLGAERFLLKPTEPDAFVRAIGEVIRDHEVGTLVAGMPPVQDDAKYLKRYNERLIEKLEDKMAQLERLNRTMTDSQRFLHTIIQSEPECVKLVGADGCLMSMNPAGLAMIQAASIEDVLGKPLVDLVCPPYRGAFQALTAAVFRGEAGVLEFEIEGLKGSRRWLETHAVPLRGPGGDVTSLLGLTRDITERKRANESLLENRRMLETLIGNVPGMVYRCRNDPSWTMDFVSEGAYVLTGYRAAELQAGGILAYGDLIHPEDREALWAKCQVSLAARKRCDNEYRLVTKDGETKWVWERAEGVYAPDGVLISIEGFVTDITERMRAEQEVKDLNRELEARVADRTTELSDANRELESFSYSVSHDLRAPLRVIDGFSKVLLDDYRDRLDETGREHVRRIRAAAERMGHLIDDLLDLSRVSRTSMHREPVDLSALAQSVAAVLRATEPERAVEWVIAPGVTVRGDSRLLRIALENLFGNAWKFTKRTEYPRVEFGMSRDGDEAVYWVRDNGAGFDMGYADRLFGTFQRLHTADEFPGTGVGLAIVRRIIQRHGGRIWAEGAVGRGAVLSFTLNVREEA